MDKVAHAAAPRSEAEVPTDLLASLLIERAIAASRTRGEPENLSTKIFGVMAVTSLLTFGTLVAGYQLLFANQLFA